jgi:hypothetical protein
MCLASPGIGSRGTVPLEHRTGLPAGQAHQVRLTTTFGEPLVGEGVPQPVGVQISKTSLATAAFQHLHQPRGRQPSLLAQPQPLKVRLWVTDASAKVAVQRQCGRSAERQRPLPATLAQHQQHVQVEVHIRRLEAGELPAARAPVSSSSVMMAVSRRASKPLPAQTASSRRRPSSGSPPPAACPERPGRPRPGGRSAGRRPACARSGSPPPGAAGTSGAANLPGWLGHARNVAQ